MTSRSTPSRRIAGVYGAPDKPVVAHAKLEVSSDLSELARVREFVRHVCRELDGHALDEPSTTAVQLAATEAASNIMRHAYRGETGRTIDVSGEILDDRVRIAFSHDGDPFEPAEVPEPQVDASTRGGLGLYIMLQILDDVVHTEDDAQRPSMTLIKNRQPGIATESEKDGQYAG